GLAVSLGSVVPAWAAGVRVLHTFSNNGRDGYLPGQLSFGPNGVLYGTAYQGGKYGFGIVYQLTPQTGGGWVEKILWVFLAGKAGEYPTGSLAVDASGNIYGTTVGGGVFNGGTAYELSLVNGKWTKKTLVNFGKTGPAQPYSGLTFGANGVLYGFLSYGGPGVV